MFIQYLVKDPQYFMWWVTIVIFSVCVHEFFHALAAYREGDSTARDQGYFTLNPLVHMGTPSLLILFITGMCWGACPVNPNRLKHRYSEALVAFAGPFANLLLMFLFAVLGLLSGIAPTSLISSPVLQENLIRFFQLASLTNGTLFVLNMIPIPPLDGHAVLSYFVPSLRSAFAQVQGMMFPILFLMLSMGLGRVLWGAGAFLSNSAFALSGTALLLIRGAF